MGNDRKAYAQVEDELWRSVGAIRQQRTVRLRTGESMRLQELGEGPPLLFVHGAANAGSSWVSLAAALSDGYRCLLLDRPGCGLSDPIKGGPLLDIESVESYADDMVVSVLDALELSSASVLATSYGGYFALRAAAAHPDRIDHIVEYSWPMGAPMDRVPLSMRMAALPGMQSMMSKMPMTRRTVKMLLRQIGLDRAIRTGTFDDHMIDWFVAVLRDTDSLTNDARSSPKVITPIKGLNERMLFTDELLSRVTMPSLFLWGDEDPNGGALVAKAFVSRLPAGQLDVIHEAGHAPWIDELEYCTSATRNFLSA